MHESDTEDSPRSRKKNELTEHLGTAPKDAIQALATQLKTIAKSKNKEARHIPDEKIQEATLWIQSLQDNMAAMAAMTDEQLTHLEDLEQTAKAATKEYAAKRGKLFKTNWAAASLMYWLSFAPGKIVTNAASGILTAAQLPMAASFAPWINTLGVPFIQVLFAEPMGGARRNDGQSYQSPDGAAYANYQTAHALLIRAWIEGNRDDASKYQKVMGEITDKLIEREQKRHADGTRRIPKALTSGATDAADPPLLKPVDWARLRSFLSDEVPVHTFSLLNGITGGVSLLWPGLMSRAWARAPDAGVHVLMGTLAMAWMFDLQNRLRKGLQGASVAHGADSDILALKRAAPMERLRIWTEKKEELRSTLQAVTALEAALGKLLSKAPEKDERAIECLTQAGEVKREIELKLKDLRRYKEKAERQKRNWESGGTRVCAAFTSTISSYMGETDKQPVKWLDGSPIVVRNISKLFGYMAALSPAAVHAMVLAQMLLEPTVPGHNATVPTAPTGHDNAFGEYAMASTVALTAICGWTMRNLVCVPVFEHLIHGTIGVANRIVNVGHGLCGIAPVAPHQPQPLIHVATDAQDIPPDKSRSSSSNPASGARPDSSSSEGHGDAKSPDLVGASMFPDFEKHSSPRGGAKEDLLEM